jgi:hypothetical protein
MESKLYNQYYKSAHIADMGGYGLSGGNRDYIYAGEALSGGRRLRRMNRKGGCANYPERVMEEIKMTGGTGLSGGRHMGKWKYPDEFVSYPHSFPMPGYNLGQVQGMGVYEAGMLSGGTEYGEGLSGTYGGRRRRQKSMDKVQAGRKAAEDNPWIKAVKAYMRKTGKSYKESLIALKRRK